METVAKKRKTDKSLNGWITGLILPPVSFILIFLLLHTHQTLGDFVTKAIAAKVLTKFLSLAVIPNLLLFFVFIWLKMDRAAKGVLYATFVTALIVIGLNVIL